MAKELLLDSDLDLLHHRLDVSKRLIGDMDDDASGNILLVIHTLSISSVQIISKCHPKRVY